MVLFACLWGVCSFTYMGILLHVDNPLPSVQQISKLEKKYRGKTLKVIHILGVQRCEPKKFIITNACVYGYCAVTMVQVGLIFVVVNNLSLVWAAFLPIENVSGAPQHL